jgi:probable F420-dependent oxidoreductase
VKFWQSLSFTETDQLVALARICEEVGFHGAFVSDHLFFPQKLRSKYPYSADGLPPFGPETEWPDSWCAVSAMAAATTRLRFTTGVYIATLRHPLLVAKAVSTAAVLSGGRVALGAGVGWIREEYDLLGEDFATRGRRLDEMIEVLKKVWAGGMVEHRGEFYAFERLQVSPAPPGPIPVYVGGASPAARRRAARNDGWLGTGDDPAAVPGIVAELRRERAAAGKDALPFEIIVALTAAPDRDLFRRMQDAGVTGIVSYPLLYTLGPGSTLAQKRAALEGYAEAFIGAG